MAKESECGIPLTHDLDICKLTFWAIFRLILIKELPVKLFHAAIHLTNDLDLWKVG